MYWSSLTLTTSGQQVIKYINFFFKKLKNFKNKINYLKPYPSAILHYLLEIFDTIVGVLVFAVIVGSVGNVVTTMNRGRSEVQQLLDGIKFYMNYRLILY